MNLYMLCCSISYSHFKYFLVLKSIKTVEEYMNNVIKCCTIIFNY